MSRVFINLTLVRFYNMIGWFEFKVKRIQFARVQICQSQNKINHKGRGQGNNSGKCFSLFLLLISFHYFPKYTDFIEIWMTLCR